MVWSQVYDPLSSSLLSTLVAMLPLVALLGLLAGAGWAAPAAAAAGLAAALAIAVGIVGMPADAALAAALHGAAFEWLIPQPPKDPCLLPNGGGWNRDDRPRGDDGGNGDASG